MRNVERAGVEAFRRQVQVVDMVGCEDVDQIVNRVKQLADTVGEPCGYSDRCDETTAAAAPNHSIVQALPPTRVEMDKAGYFVILPRADLGVVRVEHYVYDHQLLHVVEGRDARSLYWTLIQNGWVSQLSPAAYLGKELTRAELSLQHGFEFVQGGVWRLGARTTFPLRDGQCSRLSRPDHNSPHHQNDTRRQGGARLPLPQRLRIFQEHDPLL